MSWQETNEEAGKCGFEESVNKLLRATSNHDFHCCPMASGTGPAARPGRGRARGSAALGPCSMMAVTCSRHPCAAQTHCSLLKLVSDFALFIPVFHLEFFLAGSSSKGNFNTEIEGSKHSLQKSSVCMLAGVGFRKAHPCIQSIS